MACTAMAPIMGADVALSRGCRLEAYADGVDIVQSLPDGYFGEVRLRWEDVGGLRRALDEAEIAHRASLPGGEGGL